MSPQRKFPVNKTKQLNFQNSTDSGLFFNPAKGVNGKNFVHARRIVGSSPLLSFFIPPLPDFSLGLSSSEHNQTSRSCVRCCIANVDSEYICPAMEERRCWWSKVGGGSVQILCRFVRRRDDHRRIIPTPWNTVTARSEAHKFIRNQKIEIRR